MQPLDHVETPKMINAASGALLTIAVPFYTNVSYLRRAVGSILAQPSSGWTVLIVDNSPDEREHAEAEAFVKTLQQHRLRYVRNYTHLRSGCDNFNRCIDLAETDLVSIVHGDDEVLPCYAQELLGLASRHPEAAILFTPVRIIDEHSQRRFSFPDWIKNFLVPSGKGDLVLSGEQALRSIARGNWIFAPSVCYRKSHLGDLRWDATYKMTPDLDLWSRVILSGRLMAGTRRPPAYSYRRHGAQTTAQLGSDFYRFHEESLMMELIAERAAARGWHLAAAVARAKTIIQAHLLFLALKDLSRGAVRDAGKKLKVLRDVRDSALTSDPG